MIRLLFVLAGLLVASLGAIALASVFVTGGSMALLFAFGLVAVVAAILKLRTLSRSAPQERPARDVVAGEDATMEMEVRTPPADESPVTRPKPVPAAWRLAAAVAVTGVLTAAALVSLPERGRDASALDGPGAGAYAGAADEPPPDAAVVDGDVDADALASDAAALAVSASPATATPPAAATRLVTRSVTPSLARRECLAQVEAAHLFMGIARRASRPSTYARLTNAEIKRLADERPVGPSTLQHIAQRMWDRREEPERDAQWWTKQYARCEETRIDGGAYVVRG